MSQRKQFSTTNKMLRLISGLAALDGLICLVILLSIPADSQSIWLLGYSRSRVIMLSASVFGIGFFTGLFALWSFSPRRATNLSNKLEVILQEDRSGTFLLGCFVFLFTFGFIYLVLAYTNLDYRVPSDAVTAMEQVKAYQYRLAPFVLWVVLLSGQILMVLTFLGYGAKARYFRVLQVLSLILFPFLLAIFWTIKKIDPFYYVTLAKEDNIVEWATVIFFLLSGALSFILAFKAKKSAKWFYILFGIACILFTLEEISWGQRIFGLESTEFFIENSDQQEINVHNIVNEWFSIRTKHVAAFVMFSFGVIVPLLALNQRVRLFFERLRIPIPPLALSPGFALATFLTMDRFFSGQDEEVAELFFSLGLFLFVIFGVFRETKT